MALVKKFNADHDLNAYWIDFDNAYIKIEVRDLRIDFENGIIKVPVRFYASPEARKKDAVAILKKIYKIPLPTKDYKVNITDRDQLLSYCYEQLKELPDFHDAQDS